MTDDPLRTRVALAEASTLGPPGTEVSFQDYFVRLHHDVAVRGVRFEGADTARPAPGVMEALGDADTIVVCPSNPVVSIGPVLAVPGVREALVARRDQVVAVSPIVAGAALKGPADRLMAELGTEPSVVGVARLYAPWVGTLVVDVADASHAARHRGRGGAVRGDAHRHEHAGAGRGAGADGGRCRRLRACRSSPSPASARWHPGTDLAALIAGAVAPADPDGPELAAGDVVVVTQKIVSKAEGRLVELDHADPPAKLALVRQESVRVLRQRGDLVISETRHGFICANAGVDLSNVADGTAALLPEDSDRSARRIRAGLENALGIALGVIVSDTFGRPWRRGVTDVAIGCAGVAAVIDLKGTTDAGGRELVATEICVADELASAAELVMGKDRGVPVAVVRGVPAEWLRPASVRAEVIRPPDEDLFR